MFPVKKISDEQLREAFTRSNGGPNPFYRCNVCGETEPGLQEYLVTHWKKCHASPTTLALRGTEGKV